ncbi:MAG TPA: aminotransferase class V-fold PLP-dependent enzyme [Oculatellaceae cyanobacterium]
MLAWRCNVFRSLPMDAPIIYFDNAATTFPKPEEVYKALERSFRSAGNAGRGGHALALNTARTIFDARENIADFLGVNAAERLIFTPGCTYALNMVLKGWLRSACLARLQKSSTIVVSGLEHNAVMRPLHQLQKELNLEIVALPYRPGRFCDLRDLERVLQEKEPVLCILTEGSNVTGEVANWFVAADLCKKHNIPLLLDAAQTAGRSPDCLAHDGIKFWCASAHKGLFGPQGLGLLYVHPDIDLEPLVAGGTGSASEQLSMPDVYPDRLEPGTIPSFLIAALHAGISWLQKMGPSRVQDHEDRLVSRFLEWCVNEPKIKLFGFGRTEPDERIEVSIAVERAASRLPIVSFLIDGLTPERVADQLQRRANIAVRSGLHCAAAAHKALGTESTGLVRASFSIFNTTSEVDLLCRTIDQIIAEPAEIINRRCT